MRCRSRSGRSITAECGAGFTTARGATRHAPLFDQVRVVRVATDGPQWTVRDIDMWQDNFPELGGIGPRRRTPAATWRRTSFPSNKKNLVPGDSLKIVVTDPAGLASDNTGGRTDTKAVYVFVRVTDRFGNPDRGKERSRDPVARHQTVPGDVTVFLRYPLVAGLAPVGLGCLPARPRQDGERRQW